MKEYSVGHRISLGPHRGTIRYVGPVPPSSGTWLGIEWDDPTRGKHSGTSPDGTRFFSVRIPNSASFIRPTASKLSSGCSFTAALRAKYLPSTGGATKTTQAQGGEKQQYSRKNIADIEIEAPNLDRIAKRAARLDKLKEVGLAGAQLSNSMGAEVEVYDPGYDVARAYDEQLGIGAGSIRETCPNIRRLDLSRSLLPDWEQVGLIAGELVHLETLLLQQTRLKPPPSQIPEEWASRLGHVQDLRLDGTLMSWSEVARLSPALPNLKHLQLGSNELGDLRTETGQAAILPKLASLSLEDNQLWSWPDTMAALAALTSLTAVNLDHNSFTTIPPVSQGSAKPSALKVLHLRGNKLDSWASLEHLSQWCSLEALHISSVSDEEDENVAAGKRSVDDLLGRYEYRDLRAILIARLPTLRVLDKTDITTKERKDAELFVYTRFRQGDASIIYGTRSRQGVDVEEAVELTLDQKVQLFPRFLELAKLFDGDASAAVLAEEQDAKPNASNTLRSKMISLTVLVSDAAPDGGKKTSEQAGVEVRLLASTPLRLAKIKLAAAVRVKPNEIVGIWALLRQAAREEERTQEPIVLEIDDMSRDLAWYEVVNGDRLVLVVQ